MAKQTQRQDGKMLAAKDGSTRARVGVVICGKRSQRLVGAAREQVVARNTSWKKIHASESFSDVHYCVEGIAGGYSRYRRHDRATLASVKLAKGGSLLFEVNPLADLTRGMRVAPAVLRGDRSTRSRARFPCCSNLSVASRSTSASQPPAGTALDRWSFSSPAS